MSLYNGLQHTDAEIVLDLEKGKVFFDYSFNQYGHFYDSQYCVLSTSGKLKVNVLDIVGVIFAQFVIIAGLFLHSEISSKYQYSWQKFLKWYEMHLKGIEVQTIIGKQSLKQIIFHIQNNIWFNYELDGDYKKSIQKISLMRHFTIIEKNGRTSHAQKGWDVIFDFKSPPQDGHLILKSTA